MARSLWTAALVLVVLGAAPACDQVPPPASALEPITLAPHDALSDATAEAAARWAYATGLDIELGAGGVPVELVLRIQRPDGSDAPGATAPDRSYVHVSSRAGEAQRARTLVHELGHLLGMNGEHAVGNVIDAEALSEVCSARVCPAFRPEE